MHRLTKTVCLAGTIFIGFTSIGFAQNTADPIRILMVQSGLDLTDPNFSKNFQTDRKFRSNEPRLSRRIYQLDDKRRIKLVGQKFKKLDQVEKIVVSYTERTTEFDEATKTLTTALGEPNAKTPGLLTWRVANPVNRSTQAEFVRVMAGLRKNGNWVISADRRRGKRGNNSRKTVKTGETVPLPPPSLSQLKPNERD